MSDGRLRPLAEAIERLRWPDALERHSPLTGDCVLAVDMVDPVDVAPRARLDAQVLAGCRGVLALLPCPTVALLRRGIEPTASASELAPHFDVIAESDDDLAAVCDAIERNPLASQALVQLLRMGERLDVHGGLVAESLVYSMLQAGPEFADWAKGRSGVISPPPQEEPAVLAERDGSRLSLVLNRPEKHNAFSSAIRDALVEGLSVALADDTIDEIRLSGRGPSFCSGGDLDEFGTFPDPTTAHAIRSTRNASRLLALCADRVTATVHGACIGAGVELPAFARHVVARGDAFFQLPELGMGLVPGAGGTVSLPRRIGRQRTALLALTGRRIDAATALRLGVVDDLVG